MVENSRPRPHATRKPLTLYRNPASSLSLGKGEAESSILSGSTIRRNGLRLSLASRTCRTVQEHALQIGGKSVERSAFCSCRGDHPSDRPFAGSPGRARHSRRESASAAFFEPGQAGGSWRWRLDRCSGLGQDPGRARLPCDPIRPDIVGFASQGYIRTFAGPLGDDRRLDRPSMFKGVIISCGENGLSGDRWPDTGRARSSQLVARFASHWRRIRLERAHSNPIRGGSRATWRDDPPQGGGAVAFSKPAAGARLSRFAGRPSKRPNPAFGRTSPPPRAVGGEGRRRRSCPETVQDPCTWRRPEVPGSGSRLRRGASDPLRSNGFEARPLRVLQGGEAAVGILSERPGAPSRAPPPAWNDGARAPAAVPARARPHRPQTRCTQVARPRSQ